MKSDPRERRFRDLMSSFLAGVVIVTGMHPDGAPRGMTCSSVTSVTLLPPTLAASSPLTQLI
jgi:flavin reductase (NADH)